MFGLNKIRTSKRKVGTCATLALCGVMAMNCEATGHAAETNHLHTSTTAGSEEILDMPVAEPEIHKDNIIDTVQGSASSHLASLALWVDSFFDDPDYAEEEAYARVSIKQNVNFYRNLNAEYRTDVSATFVLPNLRRKFRLSFEGNENPYPEDTDETLAEASRTSVDDPSVRLQYLFLKHPDIDVSWSAGVRLSESAVYTGPRFKLSAGLGAGWNTKFTQRIYWYTTNNLKTKMELRFDHILGKYNLFRQAFRMDWDTEEHPHQGFSISTSSSITQPLTETSAIRYDWTSVYLTRPDPSWSSTTLSFGYRQSVWRKWLILEIAPFVSWEEQYDRRPKPGVNISLDAIFERD